MPVFVMFLFVSLMFFPASDSFGFSSKGQDCAKCHTLKKEEAAALLKKVSKNLKVIEVRTSPVKSLWEIVIEARGKKGLAYIDFPKKHLFIGNIIDLQSKKNLTQESLSEIKRVNVSRIPVHDAILLGDKNAKHKIIVFDDPE